MKTRALTAIAATTALLLCASLAGAAPRGDDFKTTIELLPTRHGEAVKAAGWVSMGRGNGVEFFGVRVQADVKDGTQLIVSIENHKGVFDVGSIKMFLGSGMLYVEQPDQVSPAFPLSSIQRVFVHDRNGTLLGVNLP